MNVWKMPVNQYKTLMPIPKTHNSIVKARTIVATTMIQYSVLISTPHLLGMREAIFCAIFARGML